jgi:hypothetical protein
MCYRSEFPDDYAPSPETLAALSAAGFADDSWGNDVCPSFRRGSVVVWTDHPEPACREMSTADAFLVTVDDEDAPLYSGDSIADAIAAAEGVAR